MQIRINEVGSPKNMGKYDEVVVRYDQDGETKERTIRSFVNKDVYNALLSAAEGQAWDIKAEKDGKFWNWVKATPLDGTAPTTTRTTGSTTKATGGGTWETPDERAKKQVYIIRQSSISNAIAFNGQDVDVEQILTTAKVFEKYVLGIGEHDSRDDIV